MENKTGWQFMYLGEYNRRDYFCLITEDGLEWNKGRERRRFFEIKRDNSFLPIGELFVPKFNGEPSYAEAYNVMEKVKRLFYGWLPNDIKVINRVY